MEHPHSTRTSNSKYFYFYRICKIIEFKSLFITPIHLLRLEFRVSYFKLAKIIQNVQSDKQTLP